MSTNSGLIDKVKNYRITGGLILIGIASAIIYNASTGRLVGSRADANVLDFTKESNAVLASLSDPAGLAVGLNGTLGQRLVRYNSYVSKQRWVDVYSLRSKEWQRTVGFNEWMKTLKADKRIYAIYLLAAEPIPSRSRPATGFQLIKMAVIQSEGQRKVNVFYIETWMFEGDWVNVGGAPWELPWLPVISVN